MSPGFSARKKPFKKPNKKKYAPTDTFERLILPRGKEMIGILDKKMGFGRYNVLCADGKIRICRVPGSRRKGLWLNIGDFIIIEPWDLQGDSRGDVHYKYMRHMVPKLEAKGLLKCFENAVE